MSDPSRLVRRFRRQAEACGRLGSPLYAGLLRRAADDLERGGPTREVMRGHEDAAEGSVPALRLMGAVHRLVLAGEAPALARLYPSCGGRGTAEQAWPAFRETLGEHLEELRAGVEEPVQTNEVRRCAALLPGFVQVAEATGLPLRILEVGASGGLNLRWDRYRYEGDRRAWGDAGSPVRIAAEWDGVPPLGPVDVVERAGCDPRPLDPADEEGRRTLLSFVWPDQEQRIALLRAALDLAASVPAPVERAEGAAWLERRLATPAEGCATVVFHSIVVQYVAREEQERQADAIADAGSRATARAPLAWLRLEPPADHGPGLAELRLATWPDGRDRLVARAGYHGAPVRWLAGA